MIGRALRAAATLALLFLLVSALASVAVMTGSVDVGPGEGFDTPDPLPDWPFVPEGLIDDVRDGDAQPQSTPDVADDVGDPVREDPGPTSVERDGTSITSEGVAERVHERVNEIRASEGRQPLDHDDDVASVARTHNADMATREYFDHVSPEGETPADRFGDLYPSECVAVGENLAFVATSGAADEDEIVRWIVDGWMDSEDHRENLLDERWDRHGVGVYVEGDRVYATQNFCQSR